MRKTHSSIFCILTFFTCALPNAEPLTVQLQPPSLYKDDLVVAAACNRPRRKNGIHIALEACENKTIVHCYGHGGSGFTTLFGSIEYALQLLLAQNLDKNRPLAVIGSGCMGLTMALELHRHGFANIRITTKEKYNLPSWRAGGFFDPGTGKESEDHEIFDVNLGLATYQTLYAIEQGQHPYIARSTVQRMPIYYPQDIDIGVEILEKLALMPAHQNVTIDFGNGAVHTNYKRQETYFIKVTDLMQQLWARIEQLNIPVIEQEVAQLCDCPETIICNCTGLGSAALNNDTNLYPARGHFFMLKAQKDQPPLDYMLFTKVGNPKVMLYLFPKTAYVDEHGQTTECYGMLGGTNIVCTDCDSQALQALDEQELNKLEQRAYEFFYTTTKEKLYE